MYVPVPPLRRPLQQYFPSIATHSFFFQWAVAARPREISCLCTMDSQRIQGTGGVSLSASPLLFFFSQKNKIVPGRHSDPCRQKKWHNMYQVPGIYTRTYLHVCGPRKRFEGVFVLWPSCTLWRRLPGIYFGYRCDQQQNKVCYSGILHNSRIYY